MFEYNIIPHQIDETVKEQQIKYQKIFQALDRILYLIVKQGISYQGTQKTAANSDLLLSEHIRSTLRKDFFYMNQTNQNELIGKINHSNDLKKVKGRSISVDKITYV